MRLLLLVGLLLGLAGQALAQHRCADAVTARMNELGVSQEQIKRIVWVDITANDRRGSVIGYNAWVDLKRCLGSVVNKLSLECEVEETYTRGACQIEGLAHYR